MENEVDITQLIHRGGIFKNLEGSTPQEIYAKVSKMIDLPDGMTSEQVYNSLCAREEVLSTAVGNGIALPHARAPIMKNEKDQRICVVYLLTYNPQVHLKVLSNLAALFRDSKFRKALELQSDEAVLSSLIKELV